jgi:FMN phosphatase YigB (HAD superfamily)
LLQYIAIELGIPVGIVSNGNAIFNLTKDDESINKVITRDLERFLSLHVRAADVGAMKPHVVPFIAALQHANSRRQQQQKHIVPSRVLFVGDNYGHDVVGALNCGMKAVLLTRNDTATGTTDTFIQSTTDTLTNTPVSYCRLSSLDPAHFVEGVASYLQ